MVEITIIMVLLLIFVLYNYRDTYKELMRKIKSEPLDLNDYFFKDIQHLKHSPKRKLWIHLPHEKNSRNWRQIRGSYDMNLDYIALCVKSIIDYCGQYYDIILLDDSNFATLLGDEVDYQKLSGELLETYRKHSLLNLLYTYGGVVLPCSMYMRKSIVSLDKLNTFYVCELPNQGLNSTLETYVYSTAIMGSNANNPILGSAINSFSKDLTNETQFFTKSYLKKMDIPVLNGNMYGVTTSDNKPIYLEDLMENKDIELDPTHVGLYIPHDELMRRHKYNYYAHLNAEQVLETNIFISKYMLSNSI
ncbi:hypothetical protein 162285218 [Organic Lake phycodnavirus 1]|nr:hypothetical protein 162285218 [Organic Lake phycodnavirus 1]